MQLLYNELWNHCKTIIENKIQVCDALFYYTSRLKILQFHFKINNFGHIEIHAMEDLVESSLYTVRHHTREPSVDVIITNRIILSSYVNNCDGLEIARNRIFTNIIVMTSNFVRINTYRSSKKSEVGKLWKSL